MKPLLILLLAAALSAQPAGYAEFVAIVAGKPQIVTIEAGRGIVTVLDGSRLTVAVDPASVAVWVAPPAAWPAPADWCQSSGQIAADNQYLYRCRMDGSAMVPMRFGGGWQR